MRRTVGVLLFVIYIIIGVVVAAGHHYFEHLDAVADRLGSPRGAVVATRPSWGQLASQVRSGPGERSRAPLLGRPLVNHGSRAHVVRWDRGGHRIDDLPDLR
jgi:hypothetical protein